MGQSLGPSDSGHRPRRAALAACAAGIFIGLWGSSNLAAPPRAPDASVRAAIPDAERAQPARAEEPSPLLRDVALPAPAPSRAWQLILGRHWQIRGPEGEAPDVTDEREGTRGACPTGMVEVRGAMKQHARLDDLQLKTCTRWLSRKPPAARCAEYDRDAWLALAADLPTEPMEFCIDRFEHPNRKGEHPVVMVSWYEARDACKREGKRLCTEDEWTFACEGPEAFPYPNGYERDPDACVNDRPFRPFAGERLTPRPADAARDELDRLWQGVPSGARPLCRSPFGVYDLTGNVDEWTHSSVPGERPSVLKGGYWGPVRTRCRPATKAHGEGHVFYQQGFRCCADRPTPEESGR